jgi:predicted TIM-barrel fold metal-dependent hydrolase
MIIDMHVHLSKKLPVAEWLSKQWPNTQSREHTAEQFIEKMDASKPKIDKAVIFGFRALTSESPEAMKKDNDYTLETIKKYPDRYIGASLIDPSWGEKSLDELKRATKAGLRVVKVKFTSVHFPANCKGAIKLFKEIDNLGILPVCHTDWTHWCHPSVLGDLAERFPDTRFVMQHFGISQSLDVIAVAQELSNVYADTSAVIHPRNILRFLKEVSDTRMLYASDTIRATERFQPQEELNRVLCLDLPKQIEEKVLGLNAKTLLRSVGVEL